MPDDVSEADDESDVFDRTTITSPYGLKIVQAKGDWAFGARRGGGYERDVIDWFRDRPGDIFLDIGARTGWHGLHASLVGYTPHFFEPSAVIKLLYDSLRINEIPGVIYPVACSDSNGVLDMVDTRAEFYQIAGDGKTVSVPCARLETLVPAFGERTVACKLDVEGHELAVLRGFGDLLAGVDYLVVEHHPGLTDVDETIAYLRDRGFVEVWRQDRNQILGYYER